MLKTTKGHFHLCLKIEEQGSEYQAAVADGVMITDNKTIQYVACFQIVQQGKRSEG